jgi:hypothetical protein
LLNLQTEPKDGRWQKQVDSDATNKRGWNMTMVSMAMEKSEGKSEGCCCCSPCSCDSDKPRYPWGLQLTLQNEQLKALGISGLPKVGDTMTLQAVVKVTSCSEEECQGEEPEMRMSLQITELGLEAAAKKREPMDKAAIAKSLYGSGED